MDDPAPPTRPATPPAPRAGKGLIDQPNGDGKTDTKSTPVDVLIVDDAEMDRILLSRLLGRGLMVREAVNLTEAEVSVRQEVPDLILLDNNLPDGTASDFLEVLSTIEGDRPTYLGTLACPVVILTGGGSPSLAADLVRRGAGDYLPKESLLADEDGRFTTARRALHDTIRRARDHHHLTRRAGRLLAGALRKRSRAQEARRAEKEARSEADLALQRLQSALDAGEMGTWVWNLQTDEIQFDARQLELYELNFGKLSFEAAFARVHPEDRARVEQAIDAVTSGAEPNFEAEFRLDLPSNTPRWIAAYGRAAGDGDDRHLLGVSFDVTERHWAVEALQASEAENARQLSALAAIYDQAPVGLGLLDSDLAFTSVNGMLADLLGVPADDLRGRSAASVLPAALWQQVGDACRAAADGQQQRVQVRLEHDGHNNVSLLWSCGPVRGIDGTAEGVNLVVQNVTDLQLKEERLAKQALELGDQRLELERRNDELSRVNHRLGETTSRLESLLDSAPVGFGFFDDSGRFLLINDELARLNGLPAREHVGREINEVLPDLGGLMRPYLDRVVSTGRPVIGVEIEGQTQATAHTPRWFLTSFFPVHAGLLKAEGRSATEAVGCVVLDITDRKRGERLLREAKENAINARISADRARELSERANRAKSEFLAVLSHELRTPLTPVLAGAQMLEQALNQQLPTLRESGMDGANEQELLRELLGDSLATIRRNVELEVRLIDDLLDLTRITRGKLQLTRRPIDLNDAVRHAIETCRGEAVEKNVSLELDAVDGPLGMVADSARIQQVIWNLVKNAIKFTPEGGRIWVNTTATTTSVGPQVVCKVRDNGLGIDSEHLRTIFNAFEQGGRGTTRTFGGLGLGLAISRYLVDAHGGTLIAESAGAGEGSTFTVSLPARQLRRSSKRIERGGEAGNIQVPRILLVEDHADTGRLMARYLKMRLKADVVRAETVETGRARYAESLEGERFGLIISDIGLPDGSGIDLLDSLPSDHPPAIALSGYGTEADIRRSKDVGFVEHLIKPVDLESLERVVMQTLAGVPKTPEAEADGSVPDNDATIA